jgi:hypothetical protein
MRNTTATFVKEVEVTDPDTKAPVKVAIYKHDSTGGMFGVDASFLEQNFEDDETPTVADPFVNNAIVELTEDTPEPYDENVHGDEWSNWK